MQLQEELTTTENQIGFARQHYNSTVREFNTSIQTFPSVLIAGMFGFSERDYFQIEEADAAVPDGEPARRAAAAAPPAEPPQAQA